jgi:excisionase family DNA binding protein
VIYEKTKNNNPMPRKMKRISAPAKPVAAPVDETMTVASPARYLNCHSGTVYRLLKERKIPAFRLGKNWRFLRSDIDDWIAGLRVTNPPVTRGRKSKLN